jgi:hypothetical protein
MLKGAPVCRPEAGSQHNTTLIRRMLVVSPDVG